MDDWFETKQRMDRYFQLQKMSDEGLAKASGSIVAPEFDLPREFGQYQRWREKTIGKIMDFEEDFRKRFGG